MVSDSLLQRSRERIFILSGSGWGKSIWARGEFKAWGEYTRRMIKRSFRLRKSGELTYVCSITATNIQNVDNAVQNRVQYWSGCAVKVRSSRWGRQRAAWESYYVACRSRVTAVYNVTQKNVEDVYLFLTARDAPRTRSTAFLGDCISSLDKKMTACRRLMHLLCVLLCLSLQTDYAHSTHITGTFNTREFFRFLIKFGFQKTDRHRQKDSYGYIFGNVTARSDFDVPITLAILDRGHFLEYYGNRTLRDKSAACAYMFSTLKQSSYDPHCNDEGQDFLRYYTHFISILIHISIHMWFVFFIATLSMSLWSVVHH